MKHNNFISNHERKWKWNLKKSHKPLQTPRQLLKCGGKATFGVDHYPVYKRSIEIKSKADNVNFERILDLYVTAKNAVLSRDSETPITLSHPKEIH